MPQYKVIKTTVRTPVKVGESIVLNDANLEKALLDAGVIAKPDESKPEETKVVAPAEKKTRKPRAKKAD